MAREVHRHAVPDVVHMYADDELPVSPFETLLRQERRAEAPVGILDGLLARDVAPPRTLTTRWVLCYCGSKSCGGSYQVTE